MTEAIFRIYETNDMLLIHNLVKSKLISIDKNYLSINSHNVELLNASIITTVHKCYGILGIIQIGVSDFLTFVKSSQKVGNIGSTEIFEIKEVDYIFITSDRNAKLSTEVFSILSSLKKLFQQGFYYSHNYDLTNSLQNQKIIKINNHNRYDYMRDANKDFLWNNQLYNKFFDYNVENDFLINCICGYVGVASEKLEDNASNNVSGVNYILISRRSTQNAGIKTFKRGIDKDGHVANFVETEQIVILGQNVFSYVQLRGNPPVFYNKIQSQFNHETDPLPMLFETHLKSILGNKNFKLVFIMNLMNSLKEHEQILTDTYEKIIQQKNFKFLKYSYFDVDNEVGGDDTTSNNNKIDILDFFTQTSNTLDKNKIIKKEDTIELFLNKMEGIFHIFKFFGIYYTASNSNDHDRSSSVNKVINDQIGIFRINCYDCLDRSNTIQMRVGWKMLLLQLGLIRIDGVKLFGNNFIDKEKEYDGDFGKNENLLQLDDEIVSVSKQIANKVEISNNSNKSNSDPSHAAFLSNFKKIWAENGNKLSRQYLGAGKSNNRVSNNNQSGGMNNSEEDSKNSYEDSIRQRSIDILLQKYDIKINSVNDELIRKELYNHIDEYTISEELSLFIGSWNVGGQNLKDEISLYEWLSPKTKLQKTPDIYCIGLQEIVELNANYLLISSNQPRVDYWKNNIKRNLDAIDKYTMIKCLDLVGVFMIFFVKTTLKDKIKNFDHLIIKTGLMGAMGNKGSCLIRFNYLDTTFAFSCGHFAAGGSSNNSRISEMIEILGKNFPIQKDLKFREHNVAFIFGDLNFRIDLEYNTCLKAISNRNLSQLSSYDQFLKSREVNFNLFEIEEGPLNFNPTYKYVLGSQEYDAKRKRVPSWCDRVFYKKSKFITQVAYDRAEYTISDHRPIFAVFNVHAVRELTDKKSNLIRKIKQNLILGINSDSLENIDSKETSSIKRTFNFEVEHGEEKTKSLNGSSHFDEGIYLTNEKNDLDEEKKQQGSDIVNFFK